MSLSPESRTQLYYTFTKNQIPPQVAYHLEGQAIALHEAQVQGRLVKVSFPFREAQTIIEMGIVWYGIFSYGSFCYLELFSGDCNERLIRKLKKGQILAMIGDIEVRPDVFDGWPKRPVAAVLLDEKILYQSPGFDLEAYRSHT